MTGDNLGFSEILIKQMGLKGTTADCTRVFVYSRGDGAGKVARTVQALFSSGSSALGSA